MLSTRRCINFILKARILLSRLSLFVASSRGSGKHPQLMPSTPRWAVANGAGVILSVCDEEVARYETATLTAAAVPALLLPPPTTALDEHLVAGLPALEPYARLFHRLAYLNLQTITNAKSLCTLVLVIQFDVSSLPQILCHCYSQCHPKTSSWTLRSTTIVGSRCTWCSCTACRTASSCWRVCNGHKGKLDSMQCRKEYGLSHS